MSLLKKLSKDGLEQTQDRTGGGFQPHESGIYRSKIEYAYLDTYEASGAHFLALGVVAPDGRKYRENLFLAKANGENFWEKDGKKTAFQGFTILDDLALMIAGVEACDLDEPEERVIKARNKEGVEENKSVDMLVQLVGGEVDLGIIQKQVTVMEKDGNNKYTIPTDKERFENYIDKVFHPENGLTVVEARNGLEQGKFIEKWKEANEGKTRDERYKGNAAVKAGAPTRPPVAGNAAAPTAGAAPKKALFGVKK